jgi:glucose-6-phosphate-specific signal transduction histidine kinase
LSEAKGMDIKMKKIMIVVTLICFFLVAILTNDYFDLFENVKKIVPLLAIVPLILLCYHFIFKFKNK